MDWGTFITLVSSLTLNQPLGPSLLLNSQRNSPHICRRQFQRTHVSTFPTSVSIFLGPRFLVSRHVSTSNHPPETNNSKPVPESVTANLPRKPKVELKPGPLKPQRPTVTSPSPSSPNPLEVQQNEKTSPPVSATSNSGVSSVLDTTKQDFEDASRHGILVPPPKDASWIGSLVHQAKELFVSK